MSVPDYYKTADGREFADVFAGEIGVVFKDHVSHEAYHAIASAAEHRFRRGEKADMWDHDIQAEEWWITRAYSLSGGSRWVGLAIKVMIAMVDHERHMKWEAEYNAE